MKSKLKILIPVLIIIAGALYMCNSTVTSPQDQIPYAGKPPEIGIIGEIPKVETTPTDTATAKPPQVQTVDTNNKAITLSENEIVSGKVSVSQIGGSIDHAF